MKFEIYQPMAIYEVGQREKQEDSLFPYNGIASRNDRLFILCDGMGGHVTGEVASSTTCEEISKYILEETDFTKPFTDIELRVAMDRVYNRLDEKDHEDSDQKMGTTMVLVYFHAGGVMAAHLGDSRLYHIRPRTKRILYRSRDHSVVTARFESGTISLDEIRTMSGRNRILRAILPHQEKRDMPDIVHIKDIKPGDYFYVCSDGMLENMNDGELMNVLCNHDLSDEQKKEWLLHATEFNSDNHSAWLIQVASVMSELIDEDQPDDEEEARANNLLLLAELGELRSEEITEDITHPHPDREVFPFSPPSFREEDTLVSEKDNRANKKMLWLFLAVLALIASIGVLFLILPKNPSQESSKIIRYQEIRNNDNNYNEKGGYSRITSPSERKEEKPSSDKTTENIKDNLRGRTNTKEKSKQVDNTISPEGKEELEKGIGVGASKKEIKDMIRKGGKNRGKTEMPAENGVQEKPSKEKEKGKSSGSTGISLERIPNNSPALTTTPTLTNPPTQSKQTIQTQ